MLWNAGSIKQKRKLFQEASEWFQLGLSRLFLNNNHNNIQEDKDKIQRRLQECYLEQENYNKVKEIFETMNNECQNNHITQYNMFRTYLQENYKHNYNNDNIETDFSKSNSIIDKAEKCIDLIAKSKTIESAKILTACILTTRDLSSKVNNKSKITIYGMTKLLEFVNDESYKNIHDNGNKFKEDIDNLVYISSSLRFTIQLILNEFNLENQEPMYQKECIQMILNILYQAKSIANIKSTDINLAIDHDDVEPINIIQKKNFFTSDELNWLFVQTYNCGHKCYTMGFIHEAIQLASYSKDVSTYIQSYTIINNYANINNF